MPAKLLVSAGIILGVFMVNVALAAPQSVTYKGKPVTTAVPGKPFILNFRVKNSGGTMYNGVKVIFHIPDGLSHSAILPADAEVQSDMISWSNVPLESGQTFDPSLTLTLEAGTPLKSKKNIWVEVTGIDMESTSTNFSIAAVSSTAKKTVTALTSADLTSMFQAIYKRTPSASELSYWLSRRGDKPGRDAHQGAMAYHKAKGIAH